MSIVRLMRKLGFGKPILPSEWRGWLPAGFLIGRASGLCFVELQDVDALAEREKLEKMEYLERAYLLCF